MIAIPNERISHFEDIPETQKKLGQIAQPISGNEEPVRNTYIDILLREVRWDLEKSSVRKF
ncbi:hypothetical protein GCM10007390_43830 [Persicitalea jodogahamensis]|uniref:Uncharacterized protein n=1 Tax=Persicitalea jodogahamensis TaxID=402147 RepID=A0A8J3GBS6_9BACT|nr:hypothetical protein GCM10007390_43830 [Persicitalea jodogahamensis]